MPKILIHSVTTRLLHWINSVGMFGLMITGLQMNKPTLFPFFSNMTLARNAHFFFMWLLICGVAYRMAYSLLSGDYKELLFRFQDIKNLPSLYRYYLFYTDDYPSRKKYNSGQKLFYTGWIMLIIVQAITGLIMYRPEALMELGQLLGGLVLLHKVHLLLTWVFISTIGIHIYLACVNGVDFVKSMITGYLPINKLHFNPLLGQLNLGDMPPKNQIN